MADKHYVEGHWMRDAEMRAFVFLQAGYYEDNEDIPNEVVISQRHAQSLINFMMDKRMPHPTSPSGVPRRGFEDSPQTPGYSGCQGANSVTTPGPEWDFPYGPVDMAGFQGWLADVFHSLHPDPRKYNEHFENESDARMAWYITNELRGEDRPFPKKPGAKQKLGPMWTEESGD